MSEKLAEAVFDYCFAILELFGWFTERTHGVIGFGVPLLVVVGVDLYFSKWVQAGMWLFVLAPAAAAAITMVVHAWMLTRHR